MGDCIKGIVRINLAIIAIVLIVSACHINTFIKNRLRLLWQDTVNSIESNNINLMNGNSTPPTYMPNSTGGNMGDVW